MKISGVVIAKDEEGRIKKCLESLRFCDEIIVIDDYSTDNTAKIARSRGAAVYKKHLNQDFSSQRNFGLAKAKNEWVFFLDADEKVTPSLSQEIVRHLRNANKEKNKGFYFFRQDYFLNQKLNFGETAHVKLLRLAKKSAGKWKGRVHEEWIVKGKTGFFQNPLLHYPHRELSDLLAKINFYSGLKAQELAKKGEKSSLSMIIAFPLGKFLKNYFWLQGFRDKTAGFIFAMAMSFHSFLTRAKLWQSSKKKSFFWEKAGYSLYLIWLIIILVLYLWLVLHWR
ncbi:MAG: glycosyltransferase family 2 protein [Candidatus Shapirobacteria bacterium]